MSNFFRQEAPNDAREKVEEAKASPSARGRAPTFLKNTLLRFIYLSLSFLASVLLILCCDSLKNNEASMTGRREAAGWKQVYQLKFQLPLIRNNNKHTYPFCFNAVISVSKNLQRIIRSVFSPSFFLFFFSTRT